MIMGQVLSMHNIVKYVFIRCWNLKINVCKSFLMDFVVNCTQCIFVCGIFFGFISNESPLLIVDFLLDHIAKRGACDVVVDALCGEGALTVLLAQTCHKGT
jgi:hypothetical protein